MMQFSSWRREVDFPLPSERSLCDRKSVECMVPPRSRRRQDHQKPHRIVSPVTPRSREEHRPVVVVNTFFFLIALLCSLPWPGVPGLFANEQAIYLQQPDIPTVTRSTFNPRGAKTGT